MSRPAAGCRAAVRRHRLPECEHPEQGHLESAARIGRKLEVAPAEDRKLERKLQVLRGHPLAQRRERLGRVDLVVREPGHGLAQCGLLQQGRDFVEQLAVVRRELVDRRDGFKQAARVAVRKALDEPHDLLPVHRAEHRARVGLGHAAAAEGEHLVEQRERVAQAPVGRAREQRDRRRLERDALGAEDMLQPRRDQRRRQALQVELQAARQHRHRQFLRIGGREQELDVRRRFFERLQQRIEGMSRQHVHFVDQVHLEPAPRRQVLHVLEEFARVVDLGARRGVDLDQVHETALVDFPAGAAFAARRRTHAPFAVERPGEDPRDRRLADAARAREQEGVVDAARIECVDERLAHVLLADQLGEIARTPLAGEYEVAHRILLRRPAIIAHPRAGWRRPAPAPLRHPMPPLPLLPSGPGGVHG